MAKSKLMKYVTDFTHKKVTRPVLEGIFFSKTGEVMATNSHIAIKVSDINTSKVEMILHPKTLEQLEGQYPNLSRLFPEKSGNTNFKVKQELLPQLITYFKANKDRQVDIVVSAEELIMEVDKVKTSIPIELSGEQLVIHVNASYLLIVFEMFKSETNQDLTVSMYGSVKPFTVQAENITTLITPIRTK